MVFPEFATPADGASHAAEASIKIAIAGIEEREVRSRARTKLAIVPPRCLVITPRLTPSSWTASLACSTSETSVYFRWLWQGEP